MGRLIAPAGRERRTVRLPRSLPRVRPVAEPISSAHAGFFGGGGFYVRVGILAAAAISIFGLLEARGAAHRLTRDLDVFEAKSVPPQTTRAKLRGDFIRQAKAKRRDYTVEWVHLKLNDQAQRTVLCKDPFRSADDRVEQLIAHM